MHRQIGKFARKQANFRLAERILAYNAPYSEGSPLAKSVIHRQEYIQWIEFEKLKVQHSKVVSLGGDVIPIMVKLLTLSQKSTGKRCE